MVCVVWDKRRRHLPELLLKLILAAMLSHPERDLSEGHKAWAPAGRTHGES